MTDREAFEVWWAKNAMPRLIGQLEIKMFRGAPKETVEPIWQACSQHYEARIKQLQAENEQLRKDAERYRFLRDKANANKSNPFISILNKDVFSQWTGENADEAIDKAMAETK